MGSRCTVCSSPEDMATVAEMGAAGHTDRAIAETLNIGRMSVQRHRTRHMTGKVGMVAQQRQAAEQRLAVLESAPPALFDPASYLSRDGIAADLDAIDRRLSVAAMAAAVDGRSAVLAQLSAQQLRLMETRAKLGEVGGYGRERSNGGGGSGAFTVSISINGREHSNIIATAYPHDEQCVAGESVLRPLAALEPDEEPEQHPLAAGGPAAIFRSLGAS